MRPPTMAAFPQVGGLPGGNQYGGAPINPFEGPGPVRPLMAPRLGAQPVTRTSPNIGQVKFNPLNPTIETMGTVRDRAGTPLITTSDQALRPPPAAPQVTPAGSGTTVTASGKQPILGTTSPPPSPSDVPSSRIPTSPPPPPPAPATPAPGFVGRPVFSPSGLQQSPTMIAPSFSGAGGLLGAVPTSATQMGTQFNPGGVISDIRNKDDVQPMAPDSGTGANTISIGPSGQRMIAMARKSNNPFAKGLAAGMDMRAAMDNRAAPAQALPADTDMDLRHLYGRSAPASFEAGGANPMMGMGAQAVPPGQGQLAQYGLTEAPQPQQYIPNIPQLQLYKDDQEGSDYRMKNILSGPESDRGIRHRMMSHGSPYVASPIEAKKDIQPVDPTMATRDYWRPVVDATMAEPQKQFPSFSAPPIVPGRGQSFQEAVGEPAIDLRPAQGYSYRYKNPNMPGAKEGDQVGPMAQHLELTYPGKTVVSTNPQTGMKQVDTNRLTMVNTSAIAEMQKKLDSLTGMLDAAYARESGDTGPRFVGNH